MRKRNQINYGDIKGTLQKQDRSKNYYLFYRLNGKQKKKSMETFDFLLAKNEAEKILKEEYYQNSGGYRLSDLRENWLKHHKDKSGWYIKDIHKHWAKFQNFFENCNANMLGKEDLLVYKTDFLDVEISTRNKPFSNTYKRNNLKNIKVVWNWGLNRQMVERNIFHNLKLPKAKLRKEFLLPEQLKHIVSSADKYGVYGHLTRLLVYMGLRLGELHNLKWKNITENYIKLVDTKADPEAVIKMRETYEFALLKIYNYHDKKRPEYVASFKNGNHISYDTLGRNISKLLNDCGFPGMTAHHLRHSFVTNLLLMGLTTSEVKTLARHKSILTTERYTHLTDYFIKDSKIMKAFDKIFKHDVKANFENWLEYFEEKLKKDVIGFEEAVDNLEKIILSDEEK